MTIKLKDYEPDLRVVYGAIQKQMSKLPAVFNLFTQPAPKWYECGKRYYFRGRWRACRKYAAHPGRHACTSTKQKWL